MPPVKRASLGQIKSKRTFLAAYVKAPAKVKKDRAMLRHGLTDLIREVPQVSVLPQVAGGLTSAQAGVRPTHRDDGVFFAAIEEPDCLRAIPEIPYPNFRPILLQRGPVRRANPDRGRALRHW